MKKITITIALTLIGIISFSQEKNNSNSEKEHQNQLSNNNTGVTIGGYAQIDYNEPEGTQPGLLDVHRLVMFLGYKYNDKVSFISEIEVEHANEIALEQAYLKYEVKQNFNVLAGIILVPMGIINEYHEPPTYYGVERPNVDTYIVPTTWRELGVGISGKIDAASLKYQAYIFNGFKSFENSTGSLKGINGLRNGRQEGMESMINSPNFSAKLDYYGIAGLRLGLSGYFGKTQTDNTAITASTVGVSMIGLDARYRYNHLEFRSQFIYTSLSNTAQYNTLTGNDLGAAMFGFYGEIAYNFNLANEQQLTPFFRYEKYNTQLKTAGNLIANKAYDRNEMLVGLNYKITEGAAFKVDYQFLDNALLGNVTAKQFNAGVAVWF